MGSKVEQLQAIGFTRQEILAALLGADAPTASKASSPWQAAVGQACVVRGYGSGIHVGTVTDVSQSSDGRLCVALAPGNVRLWYWKAVDGRTLSAVASRGIAAGSKTEACDTAKIIPDCCELIAVADEALPSLTVAKWG